MTPRIQANERRARCVGLFAGIGGFELGFSRAGYDCVLLCDSDPYATAVLKHRFPGITVHSDIRTLKKLPAADVVTAGFPCQDLSQVGPRRGISGNNSALVEHVFRLVEAGRHEPKWLVLENVPFMLTLKEGEAMTLVTARLEKAGFRWAYRTVDTRAFGLPQRRKRVLVVASRSADPRIPLFSSDTSFEFDRERCRQNVARGFYWTEGNTGVGWAVDSIPTLKGGSGLSIPSPPAIWVPSSGEIGTPDIRDAERLQGFPQRWTLPAARVDALGSRARWRLVGNAVSVPVAEWLARRLRANDASQHWPEIELQKADKWPPAGWGEAGHRFAVDVSAAPVARTRQSLLDYLKYPTQPLSHRAASGFLQRARQSSLNFETGFLDAMESHIRVACRARARPAIPI